MIRGIDISNWQGEINFPRLAQTDVRLLYIKATEGTDYRDPRLDDYYDGARREGLKTAFYHYLLARNMRAWILRRVRRTKRRVQRRGISQERSPAADRMLFLL